MMKTTLRNFILFSVFLLAACQVAPVRRPAATSLPPVNVAQPAVVPTLVGDSTRSSAATATPAPTTSALPTPDPAAAAVQEYRDALQSGNFEAAANLLSSYSLMVEEMTRTQAGEELQIRMTREKWSGFQILDTRTANEKTVLVRVTYQLEQQDAKTGEITRSQVDALWPVRLENGKWLVNHGNLIDFHTLDVPEQTTAGLTVKPRQLTRYSDRIRLTLLVQNQTNDPIFLGQANEVMAAFFFGEQQVEAEKTRLIFDRLRSYPDVVIEVKGLFDRYPDGVVIRQWKNLDVAPWFAFQLTQ